MRFTRLLAILLPAYASACPEAPGRGQAGVATDTPADLCTDGQACEHDACAGHGCPCVPTCTGECGRDGCGGYCAPCGAGGSGWTLCDEATRSCVAPAADCEDGWCRIPASSFVTGSLPGGGDAFAVPSHPVVLTRAFEIMQTEVTLRQWLAVLSPTLFPWPVKLCGPECAIDQVTLFDALAYANAVSAAAGLPPCYELAACEGEAGAGLRCATATFAGPDCPGYRLPSEAEWELAAGASRQACFPNGDNPQGLGSCGPGPLDEVAYYCGNSAATYDGCFDCSLKGGPSCCGPQPVGALAPNAFGLHDTSGNVRELTGSHYREPAAIAARVDVDPGYDATFVGGEAPTRVAIRGGSFRSADVFACSSSRAWSLASVPRAADGLRLVRTLPPSRRRPPS